MFSIDFGTLALLAVALGVRHGWDADHLATIDAMTRINSARGARWAKACGALFSLGHGAIVVAIALFAGFIGDRISVPAWLEISGFWVSVSVLFLLGAVNLHAAYRAPSGHVVRISGIRAHLLERFAPRRPLTVFLIGSAYAFSFDTVSQAALFSSSARSGGGAVTAGILSLLFVLGMLAADGVNGICVAHFVRRADRRAAAASKIMAVTVGAVSLGMAVVTVAQTTHPTVLAWVEAGEGLGGVAVTLLILLGYTAAMIWTKRAI